MNRSQSLILRHAIHAIAPMYRIRAVLGEVFDEAQAKWSSTVLVVRELGWRKGREISDMTTMVTRRMGRTYRSQSQQYPQYPCGLHQCRESVH